jgi:hypothetical protein
MSLNYYCAGMGESIGTSGDLKSNDIKQSRPAQIARDCRMESWRCNELPQSTAEALGTISGRAIFILITSNPELQPSSLLDIAARAPHAVFAVARSHQKDDGGIHTCR